MVGKRYRLHTSHFKIAYYISNGNGIILKKSGKTNKIPLLDAPLQLNLGRWKKTLCPKISSNKVSTNESLPLDYARHSCTYSRTFILEKILEARTE